MKILLAILNFKLDNLIHYFLIGFALTIFLFMVGASMLSGTGCSSIFLPTMLVLFTGLISTITFITGLIMFGFFHLWYSAVTEDIEN